MSIKQWIVVRKDLGMRKGKMIAQGAHASMKVFFDRLIWTDEEDSAVLAGLTPAMVEWMTGSFAKIALGVDSEEELLSIYEQARKAGLPCSLITDSGLTEFGGVPTKTAVAVGPCKQENAEHIVGSLKLL